MRLGLVLGWGLAAAGYLGPWIAHPTAALTLTGADMGEFVKFLPPVREGTLEGVSRQAFYLPPLAVVAGIALLVGSQRVGFPRWLRVALLVLTLPISVQVLPPAWSLASLVTAEFRAQAIALGVSWLLLAGFWLWGRLPAWFSGPLAGLLSAAALGVVAWQLWLVKPAIGEVYGSSPSLGWGVFLCGAGLAILAGEGLWLLREAGRQAGDRGYY